VPRHLPERAKRERSPTRTRLGMRFHPERLRRGEDVFDDRAARTHSAAGRLCGPSPRHRRFPRVSEFAQPPVWVSQRNERHPAVPKLEMGRLRLRHDRLLGYLLLFAQRPLRRRRRGLIDGALRLRNGLLGLRRAIRSRRLRRDARRKWRARDGRPTLRRFRGRASAGRERQGRRCPDQRRQRRRCHHQRRRTEQRRLVAAAVLNARRRDPRRARDGRARSLPRPSLGSSRGALGARRIPHR
jgi:hypothetical protein